jgi:hypothetical protein
MEHFSEITVLMTEVRVQGLPAQNPDGTTDCLLQYNFTGGYVFLGFFYDPLLATRDTVKCSWIRSLVAACHAQKQGKPACV